VYHDFVKDRQPPAALLNDAFISINSLSKVYGLSFLRCGWIMASPAVIEKVRQVGILTANFGSHLTEMLASLVFANIEEYDRHWLTLTSRNRNIVQDGLSPLLEEGRLVGKIPTAGCTFFPQVANVSETRRFTQELASQHQVFVVPGDFFGRPDCIRIGFGGNSEELQRGLERLA
jgi:aspartate/methionine/tyrosine aminotransferase